MAQSNSAYAIKAKLNKEKMSPYFNLSAEAPGPKFYKLWKRDLDDKIMSFTA